MIELESTIQTIQAILSGVRPRDLTPIARDWLKMYEELAKSSLPEPEEVTKIVKRNLAKYRIFDTHDNRPEHESNPF